MDLSNEQERHFVHRLFESIKGELTGGRVAECLGDAPRDRFHAGVLLPSASHLPAADPGFGSLFASLEGEETGGQARQRDTESVMSVDFQVRIPTGADQFTLRIEPSCSIYYAVFPTWDEARMSQSSSGDAELSEDGADETPMPDSIEAVADPQAQETEPDATPIVRDLTIPQQLAAETIAAISATGSVQSETLLLPRKFRRRRVNAPPLELPIYVDRLSQPLELRDALDSALAEARAAALEDVDGWRHLGKPSDNRRDLPTTGAITTEGDYLTALRTAATGEPALPTWRAYMIVSGERTLLADDDDDVYRINVALINVTPAPPKAERGRAQLEEAALFDCGFSLRVEGANIVPFEFQGTPADYRYDRLFPAIGSNCVAIAFPGDPRTIATETVPLYEQSWYRTRTDIPVNFADLDGGSNSDVFGMLNSIRQRMDAYAAEWDDYLGGAASTMRPTEVEECRRDRAAFVREISSFALGIEVLRRDKHLRRAFELMNRVFRESGAQRTPPIQAWRLFQVAFMVIQLPTLAAREHDLTGSDAYTQGLRTALERVDVLWFPTGGGKTEAYLGLITTALFYDRLRGKNRGVSAWMRFPLRMLSLQQLDRLARVVARAEMVRAAEKDVSSGDNDPFSIGYYVGGSTTPNRITENDLPQGKVIENPWEKQQIVRQCPFCEGPVAMSFDRTRWRLLHVCGNAACYSNTAPSLGSLRGSLPIFVVDNEIYRYRPSVLVGTVDKLAVLGFQKHFGHLVSSVTQRCRIHGYASFGQCVESGAGGPCKEPVKAYDRLPEDRDPVPAFLIQDELHLLKEELGTFNAHYEGFLQHIAGKQSHKPAKILAATATIEAYETQIFHLYLKQANRFPQPGWRAGESFYATSTPLMYRRLYGGVLTHQRSPESAALRALELYHRELQRLRADAPAALAELGFTDVSPKEFLDFLHLYDLSLTYVNRKATGGNMDYNLNQLVSPRLANPLTATMLTGDNTMTEVGQVIERIERERRDGDSPRLDALIATSLISHGVDLERINFLCMVGMPSKYAEYIQASSRAARNHVGLVMVCFKRIDLREQSQYHYFLPNHRYLDRLVEAVPINRFSAFAAARTIPGLIVGMLLSHYSRTLYTQQHLTRSLDNIPQLKKVVAGHRISMDELGDDLMAIIGAAHPQLGELQQRYLAQSIKKALEDNWDKIMRSYETRILDAIHPMLSFRDVDETLDFVADGPASVFVERIRA